MKIFGFLLSVMMIFTSTIISCSKHDDIPQSVTKKPFAWASGNRDSTEGKLAKPGAKQLCSFAIY